MGSFFGRFLHKNAHILTVFWCPKGSFVFMATSLRGKMTVEAQRQDRRNVVQAFSKDVTFEVEQEIEFPIL